MPAFTLPAAAESANQAHAERSSSNVWGRLEGRLAEGEFDADDLHLLTDEDKANIDRYAPVFKQMQHGKASFFAEHGCWPGEMGRRQARADRPDLDPGPASRTGRHAG